jgi:hypothetical protein
MDKEIVLWRYFNFSQNVSDIFILRVNGEIIAAVGAEPIDVSIHGQVYKGVRTGDIVVHPDHMKRGVGGWMNLYMQHHYPVVMAMGANESSYSMVRRMFKPMFCRQHYKLLFSSFDYLSNKGWPKILAILADKIVWQPFCCLWLLGSRGFGPEYRCELSDNTDILKPFFSKQTALVAGSKCVLRSYDYFTWRYSYNPKSSFKYVCIFRGDEPVGFAVVKVDGIKHLGEAVLMDWYMAPDHKNGNNLFKLFAEVIGFVKREGCHSLSAMTSDDMSAKALKKNFFNLRSTDDEFYLFARKDVPAEALDESGWFISYTDTDEML